MSVRGSCACVRLLSTLAGILFQQRVGCPIGKKLRIALPLSLLEFANEWNVGAAG
jgi:hypothetical protein